MKGPVSDGRPVKMSKGRSLHCQELGLGLTFVVIPLEQWFDISLELLSAHIQINLEKADKQQREKEGKMRKV